MGRWQRLVARFFPPETDLIADVDAAEDGAKLVVRLAVPVTDLAVAPITALDAKRGLVQTRVGQRKLSKAACEVVAALAPEGATLVGLRTAKDGAVTVAEDRLPDTLKALRTIDPASGAVTESDRAKEIKLADRRPLQYEFSVDFTADDAITVQPQIVSYDGKLRLTPDDLPDLAPVLKRKTGSSGETGLAAPPRWVRQDKTYYVAPLPVAPDALPFAQETLVLQGDAVPFFLARQLKQLGKNGKVIASDAVRDARVASDALEPISVLDLDSEGYLSVDVAFRGGGESFTQAEVAALEPDAHYIRHGHVWVPVDHKAEQKLNDALRLVEHKLNARRSADGALRVAPGQGDEARRILLNAAEIDEGAAFQKFLADLAGFKTIEPVKLPKGLVATLRPYQIEGFRWLAFLRKFFLNGILADDMGLGKSLQVLCMLQYAKERPDAATPEPTLIVCPTSCVDNWIDEGLKFTPRLKIARYGGTERELALASQPDILVTSYETLRRDMGLLQAQAWDYVILDEAQKIKNPITETARASRNLLARHRLAVTGTPIENRLDELWALFDFLMPGYLGSQARFKRDFDGPISREKSAAAAEELKRKIAPFVLRRMKEQVATDLPPKLYVARECKLTKEQSQLYARVAGEGRDRVLKEAQGKDRMAMSMSILASLTQLKQICCHPALLEAGAGAMEIDGRSGKFELFKEVLDERLEAGDKVLVFSQYAEMCRLIERYLQERGIPSLYLDGQTRNRQDLVRQFQSDSNIKVFVLSLRAAGFGITLTAASSVIHYDRWWNPAVENQATDRAYRIGQQRSVQVVQFRTQDTIEEKIDKLLTSKSELFGDVIDVDLNGKSVTRDELLDLFTFSPLHESATQDGLPIIPADPQVAAAMVG